MMSIFKELYYWMYWYLSKIKTARNIEKSNRGYLLICLFQGLNILMVYGIINSFLRIKLGRDECIYSAILLSLILMVINRFYLYKKREGIFEKYGHDTPQRRRRGKIIFWLYVVCSLFLFFYLGETLIRPALR
jgi:hypothetical protein